LKHSVGLDTRKTKRRRLNYNENIYYLGDLTIATVCNVNNAENG